MDKLIIESTKKTPKVDLDNENGVLKIIGRSIPDNCSAFYEPIYRWVDDYAVDSIENTEVVIDLEYFNTSTSKCMLIIFRKLEAIKVAGKEISIKWYYDEEDEDMYEVGQDFQSLIIIPFKMIAK